MGSYYLITGISGTGITGLIGVGGFDGNDNRLFPTSNPLVDSSGFAFTDTMGNTSFNVRLFSTGAGAYSVRFVDNDGASATLPVSFSIAATPTVPEPSSFVLLGTGVLGLAGAARRRLTRA